MGMFDSFYESGGYEYEHEWQVKAYGRQLASWTIGDRLPDDHPVQTYQVEVIGGREVGDSGPSWSFATVVDRVLAAVPAERDPSLPLIGFSGGLIEDAEPSRAQAIEAAEDRAEQVAFDAARERS